MDHPKRLLIVDDEPRLRALLERFLTRLGYTVDGFDEAQSALARFAQSPRDYAVVVTDLTLPGVGGEEMLARMRELNPDLPAIVASGYPHEPESPNTRFLQKPFLPQVLADAVKEMLG